MPCKQQTDNVDIVESNFLKYRCFLKQLVIPYHPTFAYNHNISYVLNNPLAYNIPLLVEESIAYHGKLKRSYTHGEDFKDGSDCKTSSIRAYLGVGNKNTYSGNITNVIGTSGKHKTGALRIIIYNPHKDELNYFFIDKKDWVELAVKPKKYSTTKPWKSYIHFRWHKKTNTIPKLEIYRVKSFKKLAKAS
jgi:hypothetical protein